MSSCNEEMPKNAPKLSTESSGINKASSTITNVRKDTDSNTHKKKLLTKNEQSKRKTRVSEIADTWTEFSITNSQPIDGNLSASPYEESIALEHEEEDEKVIEINVSPSDAEDIRENVNDAISQTIAKMGNVKKCKNFIEKSHVLFLVFFSKKSTKKLTR